MSLREKLRMTITAVVTELVEEAEVSVAAVEAKVNAIKRVQSIGIIPRYTCPIQII